MKEQVIPSMALDNEEVEKVLGNHGERIQRLEIDSEVMKERFNNFSTQLTRVENTLLTSNNSILQTLSTVVNNTTSSQVQVNSNKTQVILKVLGIVAGLIVAYFAGKGININI